MLFAFTVDLRHLTYAAMDLESPACSHENLAGIIVQWLNIGVVWYIIISVISMFYCVYNK